MQLVEIIVFLQLIKQLKTPRFFRGQNKSYKNKELVLYSDTWAQTFGQKHRATLKRVK